MANRVVDPGTGTKNTSNRLLNKDGSFNVKRKGTLHPVSDLYHYLVNMKWGKFLLLVFLSYTVLNTFFALIYLACGVEQMNGIVKSTLLSDFLNCFFFSAQSLTTVGYGNISPATHLTQMVASFEALIGVMNFALITGILFGRFSKPTSKISYSENALIAPFEDGMALMIRLADKRNNVLINAKAAMLYSYNEKRANGDVFREYFGMPLELDSISAMPLSWTIVHPINDKSPLYNKTINDIIKEDGEIMIQFNAFDTIFHETIFSRHSYTGHEIINKASFLPAFQNVNNTTEFDLHKISLYKKLND